MPSLYNTNISDKYTRALPVSLCKKNKTDWKEYEYQSPRK